MRSNAQANPAAILALLAERDALIARLEAAERDLHVVKAINENLNRKLDDAQRKSAHCDCDGGQHAKELAC